MEPGIVWLPPTDRPATAHERQSGHDEQQSLSAQKKWLPAQQAQGQDWVQPQQADRMLTVKAQGNEAEFAAEATKLLERLSTADAVSLLTALRSGCGPLQSHLLGLFSQDGALEDAQVLMQEALELLQKLPEGDMEQLLRSFLESPGPLKHHLQHLLVCREEGKLALLAENRRAEVETAEEGEQEGLCVIEVKEAMEQTGVQTMKEGVQGAWSQNDLLALAHQLRLNVLPEGAWTSAQGKPPSPLEEVSTLVTSKMSEGTEGQAVEIKGKTNVDQEADESLSSCLSSMSSTTSSSSPDSPANNMLSATLVGVSPVPHLHSPACNGLDAGTLAEKESEPRALVAGNSAGTDNASSSITIVASDATTCGSPDRAGDMQEGLERMDEGMPVDAAASRRSEADEAAHASPHGGDGMQEVLGQVDEARQELQELLQRGDDQGVTALLLRLRLAPTPPPSDSTPTPPTAINPLRNRIPSRAGARRAPPREMAPAHAEGRRQRSAQPLSRPYSRAASADRQTAISPRSPPASWPAPRPQPLRDLLNPLASDLANRERETDQVFLGRTNRSSCKEIRPKADLANSAPDHHVASLVRLCPQVRDEGCKDLGGEEASRVGTAGEEQKMTVVVDNRVRQSGGGGVDNQDADKPPPRRTRQSHLLLRPRAPTKPQPRRPETSAGCSTGPPPCTAHRRHVRLERDYPRPAVDTAQTRPSTSPSHQRADERPSSWGRASCGPQSWHPYQFPRPPSGRASPNHRAKFPYTTEHIERLRQGAGLPDEAWGSAQRVMSNRGRGRQGRRGRVHTPRVASEIAARQRWLGCPSVLSSCVCVREAMLFPGSEARPARTGPLLLTSSCPHLIT